MLEQFFGSKGRMRKTRKGRNRPASCPVEVQVLEMRRMLTPIPPLNVAAVGVSATAITVSWNASPDPTVTGYNIVEQVWVRGTHGPKGSGGGGHYVYNLVDQNVTGTSATLSGLAAGSGHSYLVSALSPSGNSPYSAVAYGRAWSAPSFANSSSIYLLSSGALFSGPVPTTAGVTTQIKLLINGTPLNYSVAPGGPSGVSIDPQSGIVSFTPTAKQVGTVSATFQVSNALGSLTQTIQFNVTAQSPGLLQPKLKLASTSAVYNGGNQQVVPQAFAADGKTPLAGTFSVSYNGYSGPYAAMHDAGKYDVVITFNSADPHYASASLTTKFTITKQAATISNLNALTITQGDATAIVTGTIAVGFAAPSSEYVLVTVNGVSEPAVTTNGGFTASFPASTWGVGTYPVTVFYPGDTNLAPATNTSLKLKVTPTAVPVVTVEPPAQITVTAGDGFTISITVTGSPLPSIQWQISTDGGQTYSNIVGNLSSTSTVLSIAATSAGENGYKFRAIVTNRVGSVISSAVTLNVETDTGGTGNGN